MFEKDMRSAALIDIYGSLLTDRKREIIDMYYNDDYSLSEISENTGISRQGVRDSIKKSEAELTELDEKLGLFKSINAFNEFRTEFAEDMEKACSLEGNAMRKVILDLAAKLRQKDFITDIAKY